MEIIAGAITSRLSGSHYYIPPSVCNGITDNREKGHARMRFVEDKFAHFAADDDVQSLLLVVLSFMESYLAGTAPAKWCTENFIQQKFITTFLRNFRSIHYGLRSNRRFRDDKNIAAIISRLNSRVYNRELDPSFYLPHIMKGFPASFWSGYGGQYDNGSLCQYGFRPDYTVQNSMRGCFRMIALCPTVLGHAKFIGICMNVPLPDFPK